MSNRYKGGVISATPPTLVAGAGASGTWTLEQQMQANAAGLWPVNGPFYIEDVFSTYLYTGTGAAQTITNGVNLSGNGGLVWIKGRNNSWNNILQDTNRGINSSLCTNNTDGAIDPAGAYLSSFNSNGFSLGTNGSVNFSTNTYASWTFREQPKFFDVVTYTGTGAVQTIAHNLGSAPGFIVVKKFSGNGDDWGVYHRSLGATYKLNLNTDAAAALSTGYWNNTEPTATEFTVATSGITNQAGATYIAYLFAHDAGGFGATGTDNVISCGSFTTDSSGNATISLGYEPQWVLLKQSNGTNSWGIYDTMRGWNYSNQNYLIPDMSAAEGVINGANFAPNATGFTTSAPYGGNVPYIYIAIRRGPMKVPTSGTSVYNAVSRTGTGTAATITGIGFAPDLLDNQRTTAGSYTGFFDRLRGGGKLLYRALDDAETTVTGQTTQFNTTMDGFAVGSSTASDSGNSNTVPYIWHCYKRAPSVFDIVCYTGNGSTQNVNHNLGVAPEMIILKNRDDAGTDWWVYAAPLTTPQNKYLRLQSTDGESTATGLWGSSLPTSTTFGLGNFSPNQNTKKFVSYLFASCAGVSKVGSYTGTATTKQVDCGFTGGARFVLIKRTNSTGDWYVWDSARGIVSGNDPYLLWNTTAAEVTNTDYVDTYSAGFEITSTAPAGINANGGTFIFLAIA